MSRECATCKLLKPPETFRRAQCRDCWNAYRREWFGRGDGAQQHDKARSMKNRLARQESTVKQAANRGAPWGQEQDRVLMENWNKPVSEVAVKLNRTHDSIAARKKKLKAWGINEVKP